MRANADTHERGSRFVVGWLHAMMGKRGGWLLLAVLTLIAGPATAAPAFCVSVQGVRDDCSYSDGQECSVRAAQLGGACTLNQASVGSAFGAGQFCLAADNQATLCIYSDRSSCEADAARRHTACVQAVPQVNGAVDPYAIRRPY